MKSSLKIILLYLFCATNVLVYAQTSGFGGINIQGQFANKSGETDIEFLLTTIDNDTLWREVHENVYVSDLGTFNLFLGTGISLLPGVDDFTQVAWEEVALTSMYIVSSEKYLVEQFRFKAVPYALHSKSINPITFTELNNLILTDLTAGQFVQYDGAVWVPVSIDVPDTVLFAYEVDTTLYADTAGFVFSPNYVDSSNHTILVDTSGYSEIINDVNVSDSAQYSDTALFTFSALNNWSINGNSSVADTCFLGTTEPTPLRMLTNNNERLKLTENGGVENNPFGNGFSFQLGRGLLLETNDPIVGLDSLADVFLYFDDQTKSLHGGSHEGKLDTLKGEYSFAWGKNVGTNGMYGAVFGENTYGDSVYFSEVVAFGATAGFAFGRNCRVSRASVAMGDSAIANYFRNVAIGKNVIANTASSGIAIGNNVKTTGATAWAMGNNLTASGHFSTALGTNASTANQSGSFVYGDYSTTDTVSNFTAQQFMVRSDGGVVFYTTSDLSMGVSLAPGGGSWNMVSDQSKKTGIQKLNYSQADSLFQNLPIYSWTYKESSDIHIGPMAQDFFTIFKVGEVENRINMVDADGVILYGVKHLNNKLNQIDQENQKTEKLILDIEKEQEELKDLEEQINELYEKYNNH